MLIQISGQYGAPQADDLFWPLQKRLNDCFKKNMTGPYFIEIKNFSIVFRVSGKVRNFGSEGPEKMKHMKNDGEITIDLVFPESSWRGVNVSAIKLTVLEGVQTCLELMLDKVETLGDVIDMTSFKNDVGKSLTEFLND